MSYVLCVPKAIDRRYSNFGRPGVRMDDAFLRKERDGSWHSIPRIQDAHKWHKIEKAESASVVDAAKYPDLLGKLVIVEVERHGNVWWRKKGS
jgi:hypothetical protein